jgi:hypothetical protein
VIEHIQSTVLDHEHSGKSHDFPNRGLVVFLVTLCLTFLAHRFWIMGTLQPHGKSIGEKARTIRAKKNFSLFYFCKVMEFESERFPTPIVIFPAENLYEPHQGANIR